MTAVIKSAIISLQPGCRSTCLCQLHIKGSQSQRGAPRLLWEEEGGQEAIIVSGPEEEDDMDDTDWGDAAGVILNYIV